MRKTVALAAAMFFPALAASAGPVQLGSPIRSLATHAALPSRVAPLPHIMLPRGHYPTVRPNVSFGYHGGPVLTPPSIYVVYWGWKTDPQKVIPYLNAYLSGIGGSSWLGITSQYYSNSQGNIANPTGQLTHVWHDSLKAPLHPSDAQIQAEANRLASHFGGVNANASYVVATAHLHSSSGFGTQYCAYHGITASGASYTNLPYMPDAGSSCGAHIVSSELDGVSIVEGHEYAESETDPALNAWYDPANGEIGDLCAWQNITVLQFSTGNFAVQPLWSNSANGCAL